MHSEGSSNVYLVTTQDVLHKAVPHIGTVAGASEIKEKVTAYSDLILLFDLSLSTFQVITNRCYVMTTNLHDILGLATF